jgi:choline monooxygenase
MTSTPASGGAATPTIVPPSWYVDPHVYERERHAIFARQWLFIGATDALSTSGSYTARSVAGFPVVVLNDAGTMRGFHNVCRHRGGPVAWDGAGTCPSLVCRYHGWAYGLDGQLRSARDFGDPDLCVESLSLHPVRVETWRNLVFANLDGDAPPLTEWLGGMVDECAPFEMERFVEVQRSTHAIAANWKVYAENYQEGYHIPLVHPGLNRQIDSRHYEVEVRGEYSVHRAAARDGSVTSGVWLWRWPGLALNLYPNGMCVESYAPSGPTATTVDYQFLFSPETGEDERSAAIASSSAVLDEDRTICEAVQRNMASGLYQGGLLSPRHEAGVKLVQELVHQALQPGSSGGAPQTGEGAAPKYDR